MSRFDRSIAQSEGSYSRNTTFASVVLSHVSTLVGILLLEDEQIFRSRNIFRPRRKFWQATSALTEIEFRRSSRMSRRVFHELTELLKIDLTKNEDMATRSCGSPVNVEICVAIFLRMLAGASYLDMMLVFNVSRSTVYDCFHQVLVHVCSKLQLDGFPELECQQEAFSKGFSSSRLPPSPLHGCVGAIDGIAVKISKPNGSEYPAHYYCRKGFYAIPVQAVADSKYRFTYLSAKCVGGTHDSVSFSVSSLARRLRKGHLPAGYWYAGDEAYVCTENMITPIPAERSPLGSAEDAFNYYLSSLRMHIEQAFGVLVARWGILCRPLKFNLDTNVRIIEAAVKLHNFCIERDDDCITKSMTRAERKTVNELFHMWMRTANMGVRQPVSRGSQETSTMRAKLVREIDQQDLQRPAWFCPEY